MSGEHAAAPGASAWIVRWSHLLSPDATVLDVAAGSGRHARWFAARGHRVIALEREPDALAALAQIEGVELVASLAPGGFLLYETFAQGNETVGKPSNPAFLLAPGELLDAVRGTLRVIAFEDGYTALPRPAFVQRLCAVREAESVRDAVGGAGATPGQPRYDLSG